MCSIEIGPFSALFGLFLVISILIERKIQGRDVSYCLIVSNKDLTAELEISHLLPEKPVCLLVWPDDAAQISHYEHAFVWLCDNNLRELFNKLHGSSSTFHLLAHKEGSHSQRGFCVVNSKTANAEPLSLRPTVSLDLVRCGDQVMLNKLVIGKAFSFQPGGHSNNRWQRMKTVWHQLRHLNDYRPQHFQISTQKEGLLSVAAVGIVAAAHVLNSDLNKRLLTENYANDGLLYSLIVSPKSIFEMIKFLFVEPLTRHTRQPGFLGIIRSQRVTIESPQTFEYRLDELKGEATSIELEVIENAIKLGVDPDSPLLATGVRHKEIRKVKNVRSAKESIAALVGKSLPWIRHAATDDFKELYQQLRENAQVSATFLILMVLSTLLASFGLYADSAPVIIGAMILAPLMSPIVSLSMAFARQDETLLIASSKTLLIGLGLATGFAMMLSWLLPLQIETSEIASRLRPTLLDLGIAIVSGIASAYAYARVQAAKSLAGVSIAVALVPPLAVTGIGLGWADLQVTMGALLLFLTNLAGIVFAASATFLLLGFAPFSRARKGLFISAVAVVLVSIPLAISFIQLGKESDIVQALNQLELHELTIRQVQVISTDNPVDISLELLTTQPIEDVDILLVKQQIEEHLGKAVILEVKWVVQY